MILEKQDVLVLASLLRNYAPVDTGNLRDNGIGGIQIIPQGYLLSVGFPQAVGLFPPTDSYAAYTEYRNKTSKGWIKRTISIWSGLYAPIFQARNERGVDYDIATDDITR